MVVVRDLAQKDWAGSSTGEAHPLPSGVIQGSAISCTLHEPDVDVEVWPARVGGGLKYTCKGHFRVVAGGMRAL